MPEATPQEQPKAGMITANQAASLLMISATRVRQLVADGWIKKAGKDQYPLVSVVQGYINFRNDADRRATQNASMNRLRDIRAEREAQALAADRRELVPVNDAISAVDDIIGAYRNELDGFAARVTAKVPGGIETRRKIEAEVYDLLQRVTGVFGTARRDLRTGRAFVDADEADTPRPVGRPKSRLRSGDGSTGAA